MSRRFFPGEAYGCRIYGNATGQTIASGALDKITLNTSEFNDSSDYFGLDVATDYDITIGKTGLYAVAYELKLSGGTAGQRFALLYVNGAPGREAGTGSATSTSISGGALVRLAVNDVVDLRGYVDGGTSVTVVASAVYHTGLAVAHIGA